MHGPTIECAGRTYAVDGGAEAPLNAVFRSSLDDAAKIDA